LNSDGSKIPTAWPTASLFIDVITLKPIATSASSPTRADRYEGLPLLLEPTLASPSGWLMDGSPESD
jgi:hypothetical protein